MCFFDIDPMTLEPGSRYYFNVVVYVMSVPEHDSSIIPLDTEEQWYCEKLTDARPVIYGIFRDDEDSRQEVECYPHCVVEITKEGEIMWYEMLRYEIESEDLWDLNTEEDEEDNNDDQCE